MGYQIALIGSCGCRLLASVHRHGDWSDLNRSPRACAHRFPLHCFCGVQWRRHEHWMPYWQTSLRKWFSVYCARFCALVCVPAAPLAFDGDVILRTLHLPLDLHSVKDPSEACDIRLIAGTETMEMDYQSFQNFLCRYECTTRFKERTR